MSHPQVKAMCAKLPDASCEKRQAPAKIVQECEGSKQVPRRSIHDIRQIKGELLRPDDRASSVGNEAVHSEEGGQLCPD